MRAVAPWTVALGVLLAAACGAETQPEPQTGGRSQAWRLDGAPRPNVVVYLIDTLRADHLGCYGYGRATSPTIDHFAQEAVLFENAHAQASWTRPSVGSLFTGLFPSRHGAARREHRLRADVATMAEVLRAAGYATIAVVSNPNVLPAFGFERGFDVFLDVDSVARSARAEQVHAVLFEQLAGETRRPLFLYVHTRDPHAPYGAPPPYNDFFQPEVEARDPDEAGLERVRAAYDAEIAYADRQLESFFARLRLGGLFEDTLFVLLSDHGEEFLEHGKVGHGRTLYQEQVHVPFVLRLPGGHAGGLRVAEPVRLVDLLPTLGDLLELDVPPGLDGRSFAPLLTDSGRAGWDPALFSELDRDEYVATALSRGRWKVVDQHSPADARGRALYDLVADPGETTDLLVSEPERGRQLLAELEGLRASLQRGVTLELVGAEEVGALSAMRGTVVVEGGVLGPVVTTGFEEGDELEVAPDSRRVEFAVTLRSRSNPIQQLPPILRGAHTLRFALDPPDARLRVDLSLDGRPFPAGRVFLGTALALDEPPPLEIGGLDPRIRLRSLGEASLEPVRTTAAHARVFAVAPPALEEAEPDEEVLERLRELGYVR